MLAQILEYKKQLIVLLIVLFVISIAYAAYADFTCTDGMCEEGEACVFDCIIEEHCFDEVDNDQDGKTDCDDSDCEVYPSCVELKCSDDTPSGSCSISMPKPKFCSNGLLIDDCSQCGCPVGTDTCQPDGSCSACIPETEICDNQIDEDCDGIDPSCSGCLLGQISSRCECNGSNYESGYCCENGWQSISCDQDVDPLVLFFDPTPPAIVTGNIYFYVKISQPTEEVKFQINGTDDDTQIYQLVSDAVLALDDDLSWFMYWDSAQVINGNYQIIARAYDSNDNVLAETSIYTFTVDNSAEPPDSPGSPGGGTPGSGTNGGSVPPDDPETPPDVQNPSQSGANPNTPSVKPEIDPYLIGGELVSTIDSDNVYYVKNSVKHFIPTETVFLANGFERDDVHEIDAGVLALYAVGYDLFLPNNTLVKLADSSAVYVIQNQNRFVFMNHRSFLANGYWWDDIYTVERDELTQYPLTEAVTFPDGAIVKGNENAVYLIQNQARRQINDEATFNNLGLFWHNVVVIYETELTILPLSTEIIQAEPVVVALIDTIDADGDTIADYKERIDGSKLNSIDSDNDGFDDIDEKLLYGTDPGHVDTDRDGLTDRDEVNTFETDPLNPDTDGDGFQDGDELRLGYDPKGPGLLGN